MSEEENLEQSADSSQQPTENKSISELQNTNQKLLTKNMEVHAHSHTAPKKWVHYFWEFFMLFLAVTLGFFVENQREKLSEMHRAKEFAELLENDLKKDTAQFIYGIKEIDFVTPRIDTFRTLIQTNKFNSLPGGTWYYYARFTSYYFSFTSNDATIEQLKSSGSLRYFKNKEVINAIAQYDKISRSIKELFNYEQPIVNKMIELRNKIFIAGNFDSIMNFSISREKVDSYKQKEIKFLNKNPAILIELANFCQTSVIDSHYRRSVYVHALKLAADLLHLLKKEYSIE